MSLFPKSALVLEKRSGVIGSIKVKISYKAF